MYEKVVTKSGDVLWMRIPGVPVNRQDIATMQERTHRQQKRREAYKLGIEL